MLKSKKLTYTILLSAMSLNLVASPANLKTFAANGVSEYFEDPAFSEPVSKKASITWLDKSPINGEFVSNMKVSNNGHVAYVDQSARSVSIWRSSDDTYLHGLQNDKGKPIAIDITLDGKQVLASGYTWIYDDYEQDYKKLNGFKASVAMSSDGRLGAYYTSGAGTNGNNIANYPAIDTLDTPGLRFESAFQHSSLDPVIGNLKALHPENLNKALYEEVNFIDVSGDANTILATFFTFEDGTSFYETAGSDIILMDTAGRYISAPYRVKYPVSISNSGNDVLAYKQLEDCPVTNTIKQDFCAIIWNKSGVTSKLGNFLPFAMSGDASTVVGISHYDESGIASPIFWTENTGAIPFKQAMSSIGIDLSGWTDVYPLDIAKDGSKIVGHGINPQGIREGFLIDWPIKAQEKWQSFQAETASVSFENIWSEAASIASTPVKISNQSAARASFTFDGTRVRLIGTKGSHNGYFNVYIDDIYWGSFDTFECSDTYTDIVFESDYLGEGQHTIVIEVAHRKQLASLDTQIGIDHFEVETYSATEPPENMDTAHYVKYNFALEHLNHEDPSLESCSNIWGEYVCTERAYSWYHHHWDKFAVNQPLDETLDADGNFAIELWMRDISVRLTNASIGNLINISGSGKHFNVSITQDKELLWTGNNESNVKLSTRVLNETQNLSSIEFTNSKGKITWNHLIVSGNWYSGQVELFLNGNLIGQAETEELATATDNTISLGKPLSSSANKVLTKGHFGKFATFKHTISQNEAQNRFSWPTHYGLYFAPNSSDEFSTRLPGCSTGCEPGQIVNSLINNMNGTGTVYQPVGSL